MPTSATQFDIGLSATFAFLFVLASVALGQGARRLSAPLTGLLGALETPLAPTLAYFILAEIANMSTIVGGVLIMVAVVLAVIFG